MRFNEPPEVKEKISIWKPRESDKGSKRILKIFIIVLIVFMLIFSGIFLGKYIWTKFFKTENNEVYSAVFLTNGQVYFGKMVENNEKEIVLNNVFYIQTSEKNLVKLGNEIHGPTDEIIINRLQVVFYEKLRDDSKVVESIKNYR